MADYTDHAVNDLVDFVWTGLVADGLLTASDYTYESTPLVPFMPIQDQPEFSNRFGDSPYFIYTVTSLPVIGDDWWRMRDEVVFTIVCPDPDKIAELAAWMRDKLRRMDESARLLNAFGGSGKFNFHNIYFMYSGIDQEARNEAGRIEGEAAFCMEYVRYLDGSGNYQ
jgi:hypothetical protein